MHGEPVHGGADVLGSVGAFIEGPGFLPHLTGRQNLRAYWAATGRPLAEAHLEEALAIAGLGSALDRKVRGYSHGMRQRLGIAQAMLGLPSLLVLDEPTNGLDPPQIKAMRAVLADYAAAGRTVVISSHLLSEVEHTCSHVVVMDQGKVMLDRGDLRAHGERRGDHDRVHRRRGPRPGPGDPGRARGRGRTSRRRAPGDGRAGDAPTWWRSWSARATGWSRWTAVGSWRRSS